MNFSGERDGRPRTCGSCRFWSEMLAKSEGGGPVQAMCLASGANEGPLRGQYTTERQTCESWASGHLGSVDSPGEEPPDYDAPDPDFEGDASPGDGYPFLIYEYNAEGRYGPPKRLNNAAELEAAMRTTVKRAVAERREIRITDTGDMLVFHAQDGEILFPTPGQIAGTEAV